MSSSPFKHTHEGPAGVSPAAVRTEEPHVPAGAGLPVPARRLRHGKS